MSRRPRPVTVALAATLAVLGLGLLSSTMPTAQAAICSPGVSCWTLTVSLTGNGSGSWVSTDQHMVPDGYIDCEILNGVVVVPSSCSYKYKDVLFAGSITVYFSATAALGSTFCEGGVNCGSTNQFYSVTFSADTTKSLVFSLRSETLSVAITGGVGNVTSSPAGISCNPACSYPYKYGDQITLSALGYLNLSLSCPGRARARVSRRCVH